MHSLSAPLRPLTRHLTHPLEGQRGHLFCWLPVCFAIGIGTYFLLPREVTVPEACGLVLFALVSLGLALRWPEQIGPVGIGLGIVALGLFLAASRANTVGHPVLGFRYYGPIEGRVVAIDRSASGADRLTLDQVVLSDMSPDLTPDRVRVSLHGDGPHVIAEPGMRLILTGHLSPPTGPVEPGGFDFARMAWFQGLGAVGYTRTPVLMLERAEGNAAGLRLYSIRRDIGLWVRANMPDRTGGVAAAIITGDRSGIDAATTENLRIANLAHLLAISGLHMGLLVGVIFGLVRRGLALFPDVALQYPTKKIAAVAALCAGAGYLALSGASVATERAFIMVAVMLVAVLVDRRALTLRAVAIAALIVLALRPEALTGPGFQMSFAATTALVAVFGALRRVEAEWIPRWCRPILAVVLSSLVAGLATAPIAAAHFNRVPHYGLIANVLSVPVMGLIVAPGAVLTAVLAPIGLGAVGLWVMNLGLGWILTVAERVAGWDAALSHVIAPGPVVLPVLALGMLVVVLWRGPGKWAGLVPAVLSLFLWSESQRPDLLVSDSGGLIGVMGPEGRILSKERGESFAAQSWLENDGSGATQLEAFNRPGLSQGARHIRFDVGQTSVLALRGITALDQVTGCDGADILISNQEVTGPRPCLVLDADRLRHTGAIAAFIGPDGPNIVSVRDWTGERLWNGGAQPWGGQ